MHRRVRTKHAGGPTGKRGGARAKHLQAMMGTRYDKVPTPWHQHPHLSGAWGGARHGLEALGVLVEPGYSAELATVLAGHVPRMVRFGGLFDLVVALKGNPTGLGATKLVAIAQWAHGEGVTEGGVGDMQVISNIDCPDRQQLSELWLRQELAGGKLWMKIGKMDANVDFAALGLAAELIHSSFGVPPNIPLPTFPDPGYGATVAFEPSASWRYEVGIYEAVPDGTRWLPGKETLQHGWVALAEATLHTAPLFGRGQGGSVHLGAWASSPGKQGAGSDARGGWAMFEEPFWTVGERFAAVFGQLSVRGGDDGGVPVYIGGGLMTQGVLAARDKDILSIAFAQAHLASGTETAIEVLYKVAVLPSVNIALDLQLVDQPKGRAGRALAGLLRLTTLL